MCVNKVDVKRISDLDSERQTLFDAFREEEIPVLEMSTLTEEGIMNVKTEVTAIYIYVSVDKFTTWL